MKRLLIALLTCSLLSALLVACSSEGNSTTQSYSVHMNATNFTQSSITLTKGSSITLINDSSVPHIFANGSWMNGGAQAMHEPGLPALTHPQLMGQASQTVGPFTQAGTYHFYCTVHLQRSSYLLNLENVEFSLLTRG
ncbi:MAG: hypothetical protein J2P37_32315 [Ktedonobacteraceae bacterium]|nr:hypothetical protein [Ktedonobacteraceae bacterium]MBO0792077.1 hypothetical protein [Ktedonobacteraceae bacterium]